MTSMQTRDAQAAAAAAAADYAAHAGSCARCRKKTPRCAAGNELWRIKAAAAKNARDGRVLDAAPIPGQRQLW